MVPNPFKSLISLIDTFRVYDNLSSNNALYMSLEIDSIVVYVECQLVGTIYEGAFMVNWNEFSQRLGFTIEKDGSVYGPYIYHSSDEDPNTYTHGAFEKIKKLIRTFKMFPVDCGYYYMSLEMDGVKAHIRCSSKGDFEVLKVKRV